jgi:hypothetical protein
MRKFMTMKLKQYRKNLNQNKGQQKLDGFIRDSDKWTSSKSKMRKIVDSK